MRRSLLAVFLMVAAAGILPAALQVYQVPDLAGGNEKPSIARNAQGDTLIVYRNNIGGAAFYFKRHGGGTLGPEIIPGQTYEAFAKRSIFVTDIVADPAGNFHVVWNFDIHMGNWGLYYAVFSIATERWSSPTRIVSGKIEGPRLTINPLTNDLVLIFDSYLAGINKDVFIKVKTAAGWQKETDLSAGTQEAAQSGARPAALASGDGLSRVQAPHGQLAETNAWVSVDESDGYVYATWKADKWNETEAKWELQIVVALLNPSYKRIWFGRVTHDYEGFHVLPTIAAVNGRSMMAFAWTQKNAYYYINFLRDGNALVYDSAVLNSHRITACPTSPWWEFFSYVVNHGDKMMFVYKDPGKQTDLLRFTPDGKRLNNVPIDLCDHEPSLWPIDVFSDPAVGLLTVWATPREGNASIHYSVFDDPKFTLTISATSGGTTTPPPAVYPHDPNSLVTVTAVPDPNYRLVEWEVDGVAAGSANPITVTIDKNKTVRAIFSRQFDLTIRAASGGTTDPPPATYPHEPNSLVTVTAVPDPNYRFSHWSGDASGSANPITVTIDKSKTITANFIRIKSVVNLGVEKRVERGYFSGYALNALTWQANPENSALGLAVSAQRVYRKARTGDNTTWERIAEVAGAVLNYEDRRIPEDSDFVYAVTCVDDRGNESAVY